MPQHAMTPRIHPACRLVMFDIAGTTVRDEGQVTSALTRTFADHGLTLGEEKFLAVRGMSKRDALRRLLPSTLDAAAVCERFKAQLVRTFQRHPPSPMPGVEEVFRTLRSTGVRVALGTGFDRDVTALMLSVLGWRDGTIDAVVCGDEVEQGRPAPDLILRAMGLLEVGDPGQVAAVGDTTADLLAGHAAAVRWNIGVLSGAHSQRQLETVPHTHLVRSAAEVVDVLSP